VAASLDADGGEASDRDRDGEVDGDRDEAALTVALNWAPNGLHAPLLVAADRDLWEGVDVTLVENRGSRAALDALDAGDADVAVAGAATVLGGIERGLDATPLALLHQRTTAVLYTTREAFGEPFTSVEQLRGRRVATPAGSETATLVRLFLSQADVRGDVELIDSPDEERETLRAGEADAATGVVADPDRLADADLTVDVLPVAEGFPVPGQALVVRRDALDGRAATLGRFLAGTVAGWIAARRDPAATGELVAARTGGSPATERRRFERAVDRFADGDDVRRHGWGWQSVETWSRLRTAMDLTGVLPTSTST
jgi:ABC-type nitrate/sulfonate/bicarbonate transport system substrate-binding protein